MALLDEVGHRFHVGQAFQPDVTVRLGHHVPMVGLTYNHFQAGKPDLQSLSGWKA